MPGMPGMYAMHYLHHVRRDDHGAIDAIRCPHILCGSLAPVTRDRIDDHNDQATGTRCPLSGAEVLDQARR
ncbi:hypothetical protein ACWF94_34615 [Streptomyces sp. NPDC055078]